MGQAPFAHFSGTSALFSLRVALRALDVEDHMLYGTHDLRRGHAELLRKRTGNLATILQAGQWT